MQLDTGQGVFCRSGIGDQERNDLLRIPQQNCGRTGLSAGLLPPLPWSAWAMRLQVIVDHSHLLGALEPHSSWEKIICF